MILKDLIADVNVNEIYEHIETETLSEWVNAWQKAALAALRPVSREQVEKVWRAHWIRCEDAQEGVVKYVCSHCFDYHAFREDFGEYTHNGNHPFCRKCGKAMTDEAVEMVMERLEALNDAGNQ